MRLEGADGAPVLLGGSPLRLLRLARSAPAVLDQLLAGVALTDVTGATPPAVARFAARLVDAGLAHPWSDPAAASPPDATALTVVVPVKDRAAPLARLLDALDATAPGVPVLVVDDGSHDGSGEVARARGATVVRHDRARGPAGARNAGLAAVTSPFVAFVDSDCEPQPGWLAPLLAHLSDPLVGAVAPRITGADPHTGSGADPHTGAGQGAGSATHRSSLGRFLQSRSPLDLGPAPARVRPRTRVAYVPAAALVARVDVLRSLGGFVETMLVGEDVDLVWRIDAAGHAVRYEPTAQVAHHHLDRLLPLLRRHLQYGTSAAALHRRHPGQVPPVAVSPWSLAAWVGVATMTPIGVAAGIGAAALSTALLPRKLTMLARPWPTALRLAGRGHLGAGRLLASAATRSYFPVAATAAVVSRRARRALLAAVLLPALAEWRARRPPLDPVRWTLLRAADDAAYGIGVWIGAWRERSPGALGPDLTAGRFPRARAARQGSGDGPAL